MSLASLIRSMADAGATAEVIALAVEAVEDAQQAVARQREAARDRKRRQREKDVTVTGQSRDTDGTVTSETPSPFLPSPPDPPSPPTPTRENKSPARKGRAGKPSFDDADPVLNRIWQAANQISRDRSGRPETATAIRQALDDGATPEAIEASVRAHCRTTTDHAKGLHRIINARLWRDHMTRPQEAPEALDPAFLAEMTRHFHKTGEWRPEWGPKPAPPDRAAA